MTSTPGSTRDRVFLASAVLVIIVSGTFVLWLSIRIGGAHLSDGVDDLTEMGAAMVAAIACARASRKVSRGRSGWAFMSASAAAWAAGEAMWSYYDLVQGVNVPFPSLADVGYLACVPLAIMGLIRLPGVSFTRLTRLRGVLDSVLIGGSVLFVSWETALGTVFRAHQGGILAQVVSLAYPVSDVALASLVLIVLARTDTRSRTSLGLVLIGMVAFCVSDSSFAYLTASNTYQGGNVLDSGWVIGYLLIALGAVRAMTRPAQSTTKEHRPSLGDVLVPYYPLGAACAVFVWQSVTFSRFDEVTDLMGASLVVVLSIRQMIMLGDNLGLTRRLETKVQERTAELHHRAFHDGLTGLANRALFTEHLSNAVHRRSRSGARISVLFIDLDRFKQINDLHGHDLGDELLRSVAERLGRTARTADTLARLGGDEFAVLYESSPQADDPLPLARRLIGALEQPFHLGSARVSVRASIGIATDVNGTESAEELLRNADLAMYAAKRSGGGRCEVYAAEMHATVLERMRIEAELRSAFDHDEFILHYQPIIDLATRRPKGVEALLRWQHPRRGLVSPAEFVPVAESTGMIIPIGAWTLREACGQLARWDQEGCPALELSVNLSAVQIAHGGLEGEVATALAASGLEPSRLTLEITETAVMDDLDHSVRLLSALSNLGVKLAIDDFGTGYSSLGALRDLPVNTLKIDRSFVTELTHDRSAERLARRILQLASDFGLDTVAEGVEELEQVAALDRLGCKSVQGFLFSRPVPPAEVPTWLGLETAALTGLTAS